MSTPLLAKLEQLKDELEWDDPNDISDDGALRLRLAAASNMVRNRVTIDPAAVPPEAELATIVIAEQLWRRRRGTSGHPGFDDEGGDGVVPRGFAMPRAAVELLAGLTSVRRNTPFAGSI